MTLLHITDANGHRTVDLGPVERFVAACDEAVNARTFLPPGMELHRAAKAMSKEQLLHLVSSLEARWMQAERMRDFGYTPAHAKSLAQMVEMRKSAKAAGVDLWPELAAWDCTEAAAGGEEA